MAQTLVLTICTLKLRIFCKRYIQSCKSYLFYILLSNIETEMSRKDFSLYNMDQNLQEFIHSGDYFPSNQFSFNHGHNEYFRIYQNQKQILDSEPFQKPFSPLPSPKNQTFQPQKQIAPLDIYENQSHSNNGKVLYQNQSQIKIDAQNFSSNNYQTQNEEQYTESIFNEDQQSYHPEGFLESRFKSHGKINSAKNRAPQIKTRNILQYFWKVLRNYFNRKSNPHSLTKQQKNEMKKMKKIWDQVQNLKPSLYSFTLLFRKDQMRPYFKEMFKSRFLMRQIINSGLKKNQKATYLHYVKIFLKGFLDRKLKFLK